MGSFINLSARAPAATMLTATTLAQTTSTDHASTAMNMVNLLCAPSSVRPECGAAMTRGQ